MAPNGNRSLIFDPKDKNRGEEIYIPCGQCTSCRLERARQWALRCTHEASLHEDNCFLTLTYDSDHLDQPVTLNYQHFQKFLKRLRKSIAPKKILFYMCGEYGAECATCGQNENDCNEDLSHVFIEKLGRPHFHAIIFNHDFSDKEPLKEINGNTIYRSAKLEKLWPKGYSSIGEVNFETTNYVARYCTKKITGEKADDHYSDIDTATGEIYYRKPEFNRMSLKPAIAKQWFDQFSGDLQKDFITSRGIAMKPPKYYDKLMEAYRYDDYVKISDQRRNKNRERDQSDNTIARQLVKNTISKKRLNKLKRNL